jgi:hypothetical protein
MKKSRLIIGLIAAIFVGGKASAQVFNGSLNSSPPCPPGTSNSLPVQSFVISHPPIPPPPPPYSPSVLAFYFEYYWEHPEQKADWNNGVYLLGDNYNQYVRGTAIPEPSVTASVLGAAVLAGAMVVRRTRKIAGKSEPA